MTDAEYNNELSKIKSDYKSRNNELMKKLNQYRYEDSILIVQTSMILQLIVFCEDCELKLNGFDKNFSKIEEFVAENYVPGFEDFIGLERIKEEGKMREIQSELEKCKDALKKFGASLDLERQKMSDIIDKEKQKLANLQLDFMQKKGLLDMEYERQWLNQN